MPIVTLVKKLALLQFTNFRDKTVQTELKMVLFFYIRFVLVYLAYIGNLRTLCLPSTIFF